MRWGEFLNMSVSCVTLGVGLKGVSAFWTHFEYCVSNLKQKAEQTKDSRGASTCVKSFWRSAYKHAALFFVLQPWNEISSSDELQRISALQIFISVSLWCLCFWTCEKISLSELQRSCDDLRFKPRLGKLKQSLHSFYICGGLCSRL